MTKSDDKTRTSAPLPDVVVLYADIVGSTQLYEEHGDELARSDVAKCVELMTNVVTLFSGRVVKTIGDEVMCVFPNPVRATLAANEMQMGVTTASREAHFETGALRIKIGMHRGPGDEQETDVYGESNTIAQQMIKLAKADQILTSRDLVDELPPELRVGTRHFDQVPAEGRAGVLEVVEMIWEVAGLTQVANTQAPVPRTVYTRLTLEYRDQTITLGDDHPSAVLGRVAGCDLLVETDLTSRQHVKIEYRRERFHLTDNSANGTLLRTDAGKTEQLRRESAALDGAGIICLGGTPETNPDGVLRYYCE